jgi:hypothetical protein
MAITTTWGLRTRPPAAKPHDMMRQGTRLLASLCYCYRRVGRYQVNALGSEHIMRNRVLDAGSDLSIGTAPNIADFVRGGFGKPH